MPTNQLENRLETLWGPVDLTPPPPSTDAVQDTNREFALCYEKQLPLLIRHLMRQGAAPHEAAEAAQAAFVKAYSKWKEIHSPGAWLRTVAFREYLRRPAREDPVAEVPDLPGGMCPLTAVELQDEEARVYAALASLPPMQRQVMAWVLDGFETAEISRALDMKESAVRQNLSRGRARLKELLLDQVDGGGE